MTQRFKRAGIGAGLLTAFAVALAGCAGGGAGGGGGETPAAGGEGDTFEIYGVEVPYEEELFEMLPEDVKESK